MSGETSQFSSRRPARCRAYTSGRYICQTVSDCLEQPLHAPGQVLELKAAAEMRVGNDVYWCRPRDRRGD
jgi:hypothetical protein